MGKQPYIPFYLGDYLKDTRILPLNVRGGWVDLILYMWDNPVRGELIGTHEDFARLMACSKQECVLVIQTLNQKNIFAYTELGEGVMKIESRKMKRMVKLSEIRQNAGKQGGNPKLTDNLVNQKDKQMVIQKPEYENKGTSIEDKKVLLDNRGTAFKQTLTPFAQQYSVDLLKEFFKYWTEPNRSFTKMRFELEKTWEVSRRLETWAKNQKIKTNGREEPKSNLKYLE